MKHVVVITGIAYPQASPTGRVSLEYIGLLKDKCKISIVYMSDTLADTQTHLWNGYTLYPCTNWRHRIEQRFNKKSGVCAKVFVSTAKIIGRIQTKTHFPNNLYWFGNKAFAQLEAINRIDKIDVIFSVSSPFSAHVAASKYKSLHPDVRWVSYTVDPYSSKMHLFPVGVSFEDAVKKECDCMSGADVRLMSDELIQNRKDLSGPLHYEPLPYLLNSISLPECDSASKTNEIRLVYAGSFYKKDRNPYVMLTTIYSLRHSNIQLHVYSSGACVDMVEEFAQKPDSNIFLHGKVNRDELLKVYATSDVLVNIANRNPECSPSKIFEYIMMRKPIIEFSNNSKSGYLMQYPIALVLSDNDGLKDEKVHDFCLRVKQMNVTEESLNTIYYKHTQEHITNILEQSLLK